MVQPLNPASPAARVLADASKRRYLSPFLGRTRRLTEAARELGVSPARLAYWVRRFLALGLLKQVGRGYRSTAEAYFVPFEASPAALSRPRWASLSSLASHSESPAAGLASKGTK